MPRALPWLLLVVLGCTRAEPSVERVLLVVADTLRRDAVAPYDPDALTPHVASLAQRGTAFENAVAAFHQTSMSMGSLFTGRVPSIEAAGRREVLPWTGRTWCGLARLAAPDDPACVPEGLQTLAEGFRAAGYWTIGITSNDFLFRPAGFRQGFDDWNEVGAPEPGAQAEDHVELQVRARQAGHVHQSAIEALKRRPHDRFLLYVHYMDVHDWRWVRGSSYADGVRTVDAALGRLLNHLERKGLLDDCLVVFTSDHGEMLEGDRVPELRTGHWGNPSFEPVLRVPLVVAPAPEDEPTALVRTHDLHHRIEVWAGIDVEDEPVGLREDEQLFTEAEWQTYRRWPWKSAWKRDGTRTYLFDLRQDELEDRFVDHPEIIRAHRRRIDELASALAGGRADPGLIDEDRARLRALGYVEE